MTAPVFDTKLLFVSGFGTGREWTSLSRLERDSLQVHRTGA
jgi:hypothetical protein